MLFYFSLQLSVCYLTKKYLLIKYQLHRLKRKMLCFSHTRTRQTTRVEIRHVYDRKGLFGPFFLQRLDLVSCLNNLTFVDKKNSKRLAIHVSRSPLISVYTAKVLITDCYCNCFFICAIDQNELFFRRLKSLQIRKLYSFLHQQMMPALLSKQIY